jgi:type II secretory pathway predicted ATPase ExeA
MAGVIRPGGLRSGKPAQESHAEVEPARSRPRIGLFQAGTDPALVWLGPAHREILDRLRSGVLAGDGVLLLTGDVGTGKTILAKALLHRLPTDMLIATVMHGGHDTLDLWRKIAAAWKLGDPGSTREEFYGRLSAFLDEEAARGRQVLLFVDEAQGLTQELLTEIGQMAILTGDPGRSQARLSILLVGQDELARLLSRPENAALAARVGVRCVALPLTDAEVHEYLAHQLKVSEADRFPFTDTALQAIAAATQGIPRLINTIGNLALQTATQSGTPLIDGAMVRQCAQSLGYLPESATPPRSRRLARSIRTRRSRRPGLRRRIALYAPVLVLLPVGAGFLYQSVRDREAQPAPPLPSVRSIPPPVQSTPPPVALPTRQSALPAADPTPLLGRPAIDGRPKPTESVRVTEAPPAPPARVPRGPDVPVPPAVERPPIRPAAPALERLPTPEPSRVAPATILATRERAGPASGAPSAPRIQPQPSVLPPAGARRAVRGDADTADPAAIIDWLLSEYPARRN